MTQGAYWFLEDPHAGTNSISWCHNSTCLLSNNLAGPRGLEPTLDRARAFALLPAPLPIGPQG